MAQETACDDMVRRTLRAAQEGPPRDATRNQGCVLIALRNAFRWLLARQLLEGALVQK